MSLAVSLCATEGEKNDDGNPISSEALIVSLRKNKLEGYSSLNNSRGMCLAQACGCAYIGVHGNGSRNFQKGAKRGGMANKATQKLKKNVELLCRF